MDIREEEFYSSPAYQAVKDHFKKSFHGEVVTSTAYFGGIKNNAVTFGVGYVCHGSLNYRCAGNVPDYIFSSLQPTHRKMIGDDNVKIFFDALLNMPAFAGVSITKSGERVLEDEFFVVTTNANRNLMMSLLIHSRLPREYPQAVQHIAEFIKAGVNPSLAMFLGQCIRVENITAFLNANTGHHHAVSSSWSIMMLRNYINGDYKVAGTYKENPSYSNVIEGFNAKGEMLLEDSSAVKLIYSKVNVGDIKSSYVHPFPKHSTILNGIGGNAVPLNVLYKNVAEAQDEILKELGV